MWVDPAFRGSGEADALVGFALDWCRACGKGCLLWVADDNERARRFYQRLGLTPGRRPATLPHRPDPHRVLDGLLVPPLIGACRQYSGGGTGRRRHEGPCESCPGSAPPSVPGGPAARTRPQPPWSPTGRSRPGRFLGTTSGRKARYARVLVDALEPDRVPRPLDRLLDAV